MAENGETVTWSFAGKQRIRPHLETNPRGPQSQDGVRQYPLTVGAAPGGAKSSDP